MGRHSLLQGDPPDPGIEPEPPAASVLAGGFLTTEPPGKPLVTSVASYVFLVWLISKVLYIY